MNLNYLTDTSLELLQKYEKKFNGTLRKYKGSNYTIESKEDVKSNHIKPFPIPKIHELILKKEVDRLPRKPLLYTG